MTYDLSAPFRVLRASIVFPAIVGFFAIGPVFLIPNKASAQAFHSEASQEYVRDRVWTNRTGTQRRGIFRGYDEATGKAEFDFLIPGNGRETKMTASIDVQSFSLEDQAYLRKLIQQEMAKMVEQNREEAEKERERVQTELAKLKQISDRILKVAEGDSAETLNYRPDLLLVEGHIPLSDWKGPNMDRRLIPRYPKIGFKDEHSESIGPFLGWWDEIGFVTNPEHGDPEEVLEYLERRLGVRNELEKYLSDCGKPAKAVGTLWDAPLPGAALLAEATQGIDIVVLRILLMDKEERVKYVRRCPVMVADASGNMTFLWDGTVFECRLSPPPEALKEHGIQWELTNFPRGIAEDIDRGRFYYVMDSQALTIISPFFEKGAPQAPPGS